MIEPWWLEYGIHDNGLKIESIDSRVFVKIVNSEFFNLINYALVYNSGWELKKIVQNKNNYLTCKLDLKRKNEDENLKDISNAIKAFRNIVRAFISIGIIQKPNNDEQNTAISQMIGDCESRADILEFFLANNTKISKPNQKTYYNGRIELDLLRLIQELYLLALNEEKHCVWLLAFNSPYEIWFILQCQIIFQHYIYMWIRISPTNFLNESKYNVEEISEMLQCVVTELKNKDLLSLTESVKYTIAQLYFEKICPQISHLYLKYLESIRLQAYKVRKNKIKMLRL